MNVLYNLWRRLSRDKKYREAFVSAQAKRAIPLQIRTLRRQREWSQDKLAKESNLTQGVISRAEDPDYGNLTVNTLVRIAAGFDVAFVAKFVPFSELTRWYSGLSERALEVPSFGEDSLLEPHRDKGNKGMEATLQNPGWVKDLGVAEILFGLPELLDSTNRIVKQSTDTSDMRLRLKPIRSDSLKPPGFEINTTETACAS